MLQQTQASRVIDFYKRWLKKFPTLKSLESASSGEVLRHWSGLGYNSRALRFHALAKFVVEKNNGKLPQKLDDLEHLPGVGRYTAHAVACFAFQKHVPVVDVNIKRIFTRITERIRSSRDMIEEKNAWAFAEKFLPKNDAYTWNQALMDLGAMVCTARQPHCSECPISSQCKSAFSPGFLKKESRRKKTEPRWRGIPRRVYRGKILKLLHDHHYTLDQLGQMLWKNFSEHDSEWLEKTLETLKNEGFIRQTKKQYHLV